ncbi:DUF481 domain-containing protein [Thiomicrospira microaerophila]|uniref:DUF481 domain-containing protein n=1 Tax=Thiomicrospira microaerophila TaxID=406020 RepID=UPI00200D0F3D|nr:DUF481 domain-containing protein [Thiomicrospira microaerophila]UQB43383.1 DUF481 domain-containing protein [Thiomicrospira microaerophila]
MAFNKNLLAVASLSALSLVAPNSVLAQGSGWTGSGEAGFNKTTGNTDTQTISARLKMGYGFEKSDYTATIEVENKKESGNSISDRYLLEQQYDYFLNANRDFYTFANLRNERNKPTDLKLDNTISVGLGRLLYKTDASLLKGEIGIGYQDVDLYNGDDFDQTTGRLKLDFAHKFNETYSFGQDALYVTGSEQDKIETNTRLRAALNSKLSASLGYKYRYNSNPGSGLKKTDGETNISLIYNF